MAVKGAINGSRSRRFAAAPCLLVSILWLLSATVLGAELGGREPVLKQIALPHAYYYREMYLPQVTSGPGGAAWSPDGRELVVAMQGTLWRYALDTGVAEQLTSGPGYDHQPDWSPNGRYVAYATYNNDAMEIRLLELQSGATLPVTANRAVNLDPRWSPDGRKLAFVSTEHEGRFHVFVTSIGQDGAVRSTDRLTKDHDSRLPRFYYSRWDHYLSPTWSPDGREIILVSNRNRIWGSGGFWRMSARPGASMREIYYEETTWKARPDWSPDGHSVVYSSYLGRQWNQLWIMTDEGDNVFPLTYGQFDATAPRWSPDGRRIAYISNQGGNTSLWVLDVPGGGRRRIDLGERRHLGPVGRAKIVTLNSETGAQVPARVSVLASDGRHFAPDDAWWHADDAFDRSKRRFEYGYFHSPGEVTVTVPAGQITVEVSRGLEHRIVRKSFRVPAGGTVTQHLALQRIADSPAGKWTSGDLHVHMNYGGTYRNTPSHLALQAAAEDLDVVENLIVNKEQRIPDIAYFGTTAELPNRRDVLIVQGQEFHTNFWGHSALLGLSDHYLIPGYAAYVNTAAASLYPHNAAVFDMAHKQGAIIGYVHPFDTMPDPYDENVPLTHELPVDVALGKVDYLEVMGFSDHLITSDIWYRLLNCGFRLPAAGGTDAFPNFASLRGPVGLVRTYVLADTGLDHAAFLREIRAGRTFATNGPLLDFSLGGHGIGEEITLPEGSHTLQAKISVRSIVPLDHVQVVGNGVVVAEIDLGGDATSADAKRAITVERSGWYVLRAWAEDATHPILDLYPFATTSPIYINVGDGKVRSDRDSRFFIAWVDRLIEAVKDHGGWKSPEERTLVMRDLQSARAIFESRNSLSE